MNRFSEQLFELPGINSQIGRILDILRHSNVTYNLYRIENALFIRDVYSETLYRETLICMLAAVDDQTINAVIKTLKNDELTDELIKELEDNNHDNQP